MQKGSAMFFTVVIISLVMGIVFGLSVLLFAGLETLRGSRDSVVALYAAETGIEHVLYLDNVDSACSSGDVGCLQTAMANPFVLPNGASYHVILQTAGSDSCPGAPVTYCAQSTGTFAGVVRRVEIER